MQLYGTGRRIKEDNAMLLTNSQGQDRVIMQKG